MPAAQLVTTLHYVDSKLHWIFLCFLFVYGSVTNVKIISIEHKIEINLYCDIRIHSPKLIFIAKTLWY